MGIDVPMNFEKTSSGKNLIGINKSQSQALVPLKGLNTEENQKYQPPKMTNFKLINKMEIKNLRHNILNKQENERVI